MDSHLIFYKAILLLTLDIFCQFKWTFQNNRENVEVQVNNYEIVLNFFHISHNLI